MKCDENGGCPLATLSMIRGEMGLCGRLLKDCHLSASDFPIIKAMIAGTYDCGGCLSRSEFSCVCCRVQAEVEITDGPCDEWQPKGDGDGTST